SGRDKPRSREGVALSQLDGRAHSSIMGQPACPDRRRSVRSGRRAHFFCWRTQRTETQNENMAAPPSRIAEIAPELEAVAQGAGCELVHAELKGGVLRVFVDKPE